MEPPPRWLHCPRKGKIIADIFLPFKTPLDNKFDPNVPEECRFHPNMLFTFVAAMGKKMSAIVDLTNTKRFYKRDEFIKEDVKHQKIACKGHGEYPDEQTTLVFVEFCDTVRRKDPTGIIGVHCTHGYNRTGFLICAYLVEKLNWGIDSAFALFSQARPPGIIKGHYIQELFSRYGDLEDAPGPPELPAWHTESDDRDEDENGHQSSLVQQRNVNVKLKEFVEGVIIDQVEQVTTQPLLRSIQSTVQKMCGWTKKGFPGAQPVSMTRKNMGLLTMKWYQVSWKADGVRYMMLIKEKDQVYMADRDNAIFKVSGLDFPLRKNLNGHLENTLLDGEMILDEVNGQNLPRFLVYDIVKFSNQDVGNCDFGRRVFCINNEIILPRHEKIRKGLLNKEAEPFSIRLKQFWDITQSKALLEGGFSKQVVHEVDGLIFQPANSNPIDRYTPGRNDDILKWKPSTLNSIDFRLKLEQQSGVGLITKAVGNLYVGHFDRPMGTIKLTKELKNLNNKIIECKLENNQWVLMRERKDKSFPNSYQTAVAVFDSIQNPVTKEMLFKMIDENAYKPTDLKGHQDSNHLKRPHGGDSNNSAKIPRTGETNLMPPPIATPPKKR